MNRTRAPALLASIGLAIAVVALWEPGTSVLSGARYRLVLSLPWWAVVALAAASLAILLAIVSLVIATPARKDETKPPPPLQLPRLTLTVLLLLLGSPTAAVVLALNLID